MNGSVLNDTGATLQIAAESSVNNQGTLTSANGMTNRGLVELTTLGLSSDHVSLASASGTIVNEPGATFDLLAGDGGRRTLTGEVDNQGVFNVETAVVLNGIYCQTGGDTILDGGSFQASTSLDIQGGNLRGVGTVIGGVDNGGKLTPEQGAALISDAQDAIDSASEGGGSTLLAEIAGATVESTTDRPLEHENELVIATIGVSLDHASGSVTTDQGDRLRDALDQLNGTFSPYGLHLVAAADQPNADIEYHMQIASSSPCGGVEDGVLGCTSAAGEITIVDGWNWFTGADLAAIDVQQYDFQTVVTHELGHAVGLGHSTDAQSVMYPWLAAGDVQRGLTEHDVELLGADDEEEPSALRAAPSRSTKPIAANLSAVRDAVLERWGLPGSPETLRNATNRPAILDQRGWNIDQPFTQLNDVAERTRWSRSQHSMGTSATPDDWLTEDISDHGLDEELLEQLVRA